MNVYCDICKFSYREPHPDPDDWFEDDDEDMCCRKSDGKVIEPSMRPYETHGEDKVPEWCPLNNIKHE